MRGFNTAEVQALRARTPAADAFLHFNHASASLPDACVFEAQMQFLAREAAVGMHRACQEFAQELAALPAAVASLVHSEAARVALVHSASHGWAAALSALASRGPLQVFVSRNEWAANLMNLSRLQGATQVLLPTPQDAHWAPAVAAALARRDRHAIPVVSLPLVCSHSGVAHALQGVAHCVREAGGWLLVDASQAVGQLDVDAGALGADVLVFPARKWLRGPRGIGAAVFSARALQEWGAPYPLDIHGTRIVATDLALTHAAGSSRFQGYEHHPGLRLGLLAALRHLQALGPGRVQARIASLAGLLRRCLADVEGVRVCQDETTGLVCLQLASTDHEDAVRHLWRAGVNAAVVSGRYAPLALQGGQSLLRLSPHVMTRESDVAQVVEQVARVARPRRAVSLGI